MLNFFPTLLDFSLFGPLILRIAAGLILISFGKEHIRHEKTWKPFFEMISFLPAGIFAGIFGSLEVIAGIFLVAGFATQLAAIFASIVVSGAVMIEYKNDRLLARDLIFYVLLLCVCLSLIVTGAGAVALDLPL